jgi:hypothetical protein
MKAAAIALCVIAVGAMALAMRDMVVGAGSPRRGWALRAIAVLAFALAVVLNVAS